MPRVNNTGSAASAGSFPAANNLLQKKWNDRAYKLHLEKMKTTKTKLDTSRPKECPHLHLNLKKIQMEEEKQALIDRDNRILLSKLTNILRSDGSLDNWNYEHEMRPRTLHAPHMQREQEMIAKENERIMKKLTNTAGTFRFDKMEDDFLMHEYYKSMKSQETKTYEVDARDFVEDEMQFYKKTNQTLKENGHIDAKGDNETNKAANGDKLPSMDETTRKPPPSKQRHRKKQPTRLPLLGAERRKVEDKRKKEAVSKPSPYDERDDASKLFKAVKGMVKAETVLVQTLARRTYAQRQQTISRFTVQYELDLEEDFKSQLDDEYSDLVSALVVKREEYDADALHRALKGHSPLAETIVEILCTRNNLALGVIKNTYHRLYGVHFEDDVKSEVKGQLKHLFLALSKESRNERVSTDSDVAETDAQELIDAEADRWTANGGKLAQLLPSASFDHLRAVFQMYEKLSDWPLSQELTASLSGDYRDAMLALVKCLNNCALFLAEQIHLVLTGKAEESTLIRIIVTRSEVDLLQIRRAYRKKYGDTLIDIIEHRCRSAIKKALIQMILVHGVPKEEVQKNETDGHKIILPRVLPPEVNAKPLRGPQSNKDATIPSDNPLAKSIGWPKSPVRRVVTPRGMNKTPSSRTSSKTSLKRSTTENSKVTTPRSRMASRQPKKPMQPKKQLPPVSHPQPKSQIKSLRLSAAAQSKQKQSAAAKEVKTKSSESRNETNQTAAKELPGRTEQDKGVKTQKAEENKESETKEEAISEAAVSSPEKEKSATFEAVSSEQTSTGKDKDISDVVISSEAQATDGSDSEADSRVTEANDAETNAAVNNIAEDKGRQKNKEDKQKEGEVKEETGEDKKDQTQDGKKENSSSAVNVKETTEADDKQVTTTAEE